RSELLGCDAADEERLVAVRRPAGEFDLRTLQPEPLAQKLGDRRIRSAVLGRGRDGDLQRPGLLAEDGVPLRAGLRPHTEKSAFAVRRDGDGHVTRAPRTAWSRCARAWRLPPPRPRSPRSSPSTGAAVPDRCGCAGRRAVSAVRRMWVARPRDCPN